MSKDWSITLRLDNSTRERGRDGWPLGARVDSAGLNIGHAWVTIEGPDGQRVDAGYYPLHGRSLVGPGSVVLDDKEHSGSQDAAYRWTIGPAEARNALNYIDTVRERPGTYNGLEHNCVTFAGNVLAEAGVPTVQRYLNDRTVDPFTAAKGGDTEGYLTHPIHDPAQLQRHLDVIPDGRAAADRAAAEEAEAARPGPSPTPDSAAEGTSRSSPDPGAGGRPQPDPEASSTGQAPNYTTADGREVSTDGTQPAAAPNQSLPDPDAGTQPAPDPEASSTGQAPNYITADGQQVSSDGTQPAAAPNQSLPDPDAGTQPAPDPAPGGQSQPGPETPPTDQAPNYTTADGREVHTDGGQPAAAPNQSLPDPAAGTNQSLPDPDAGTNQSLPDPAAGNGQPPADDAAPNYTTGTGQQVHRDGPTTAGHDAAQPDDDMLHHR